MRFLIFSSLILVTLSSCTFGISSEKNTTSGSGESTKTDTIATIAKNEVANGALVTLQYTLREGAQDGKILETTLEEVAKTNNLYKTGAQYQAFQVMIGSNGVIPGFEQGLLGMKKGEKKTIEVSPELGYGTGPTLREVPKYQIAPVFSMTQDKALFDDIVTQTVQKSELREDMQNASIGQVFTGANDATAKVTAIDENTITLAIENTSNPFYKKTLKVGATAESADGTASFKVTKIAGTGVTLEITNKQSPFYNKKFAIWEGFETAQGKIEISDIKDDIVVVSESHPLMGKTLFFDVEIVDIQ